MLPGTGATGMEPFISGKPDQKKAWLLSLYKIMQRTRVRRGADRIDAELAVVGLADALTGPFRPTDDEVQRGDAQSRLEAIEIVLLTFPPSLSPAAVQNVAPSPQQATVLISLFDEVATCYTEIAAGRADQHIAAVFSRSKVGQVRGYFKRAAKTAQNVKDVLGNPPATAKRPRILMDIAGELSMKSSGALSSPLQMILPPGFAAPAASPADRSGYVDTLLHECMHVLDSGIVDYTYWPDPNFTKYIFDYKIHNADHFAQVARLYRKTDTPLPSGGNDIYAPIVRPADKKLISGALGQAREQAKIAWIYCLDAWDLLRKIRDDPNSYDHLNDSQRLSLTENMKRISRISNATLHERDPAPGAWLTTVTEFDIAMLEETIVDLAALYGWMRSRAEIKLVPRYPDTPKAGALYVRFDDLTANADALARSFLKYGFSHLGQPTPWLEPIPLTVNIAAMVKHQKAFRSLPAKP